MSTDEVNPHDTKPEDATVPATETPATAATPTSAAPYSKFEMRVYGDTAGRRFTMLVNRDGDPTLFTASGVFKKAYPDDTSGRQAYQFVIPATCVDEAFEKFDAAKAAAEKDAEKELDHQHMVAALSGQLPGPPIPAMPPMPADMAPVPIRGRGKRRRIIQ